MGYGLEVAPPSCLRLALGYGSHWPFRPPTITHPVVYARFAYGGEDECIYRESSQRMDVGSSQCREINVLF